MTKVELEWSSLTRCGPARVPGNMRLRRDTNYRLRGSRRAHTDNRNGRSSRFVVLPRLEQARWGGHVQRLMAAILWGPGLK